MHVEPTDGQLYVAACKAFDALAFDEPEAQNTEGVVSVLREQFPLATDAATYAAVGRMMRDEPTADDDNAWLDEMELQACRRVPGGF